MFKKIILLTKQTFETNNFEDFKRIVYQLINMNSLESGIFSHKRNLLYLCAVYKNFTFFDYLLRTNKIKDFNPHDNKKSMLDYIIKNHDDFDFFEKILSYPLYLKYIPYMLMYAIFMHRNNWVDYLLTYKPYPYYSEEGYGYLHRAVLDKNYHALHSLRSYNYVFNLYHPIFGSPLDIATRNNNYNMVEKLLLFPDVIISYQTMELAQKSKRILELLQKRIIKDKRL